MQELIQQLTEKFGVSAEGGQSIVSGVLKLVGDNASSEDFGALVDKVPGAKELAEAGAKSEGEAESGGLLGSITSMASSALGGEAGSAIELTSVLKSAGVDLDQAGPIVQTIVSFLQEKAGGELVEKILGQLPQLKKLLG